MPTGSTVMDKVTRNWCIAMHSEAESAGKRGDIPVGVHKGSISGGIGAEFHERNQESNAMIDQKRLVSRETS